MISNKLCLYHEWKNLLAFQAVSFRSRAVKVPRFFCFLLLQVLISATFRSSLFHAVSTTAATAYLLVVRLLTCFAYSWTKSMPGVPRRRTTSTWRCKRRGRLCKRWRWATWIGWGLSALDCRCLVLRERRHCIAIEDQPTAVVAEVRLYQSFSQASTSPGPLKTTQNWLTATFSISKVVTMLVRGTKHTVFFISGSRDFIYLAPNDRHGGGQLRGGVAGQ